jgi:hypothetical protein
LARLIKTFSNPDNIYKVKASRLFLVKILKRNIIACEWRLKIPEKNAGWFGCPTKAFYNRGVALSLFCGHRDPAPLTSSKKNVEIWAPGTH